MNNEGWIKKLERMPVPILPTMVGAATLSNVYNGMGFTMIRHITMIAATVVLLFYLLKIVKYPGTFLNEYKNTVPASLYAGFTMLLMILGSYYFTYSPVVGKTMWIVGLSVHALHILIFTFRNITNRKLETFLPSWYVTYNGIMVSCVVGGVMQEPEILNVVTYYGIVVYFLLLPFMLWRLVTHEIKDGVYHTQAILLAPCSLSLVCYLNVIQEPNKVLVYLLYGCTLVSLLFVLYKLPKFFSFAFYPGFAGMTFPMAIAIVASTKMAEYMEGMGNTVLSGIITQISGVQVYVTTAIIGFVLFNFLKMLIKTQPHV
ncbi:MAG: TDT family transporter [Lachnospiraceae bacterium]